MKRASLKPIALLYAAAAVSVAPLGSCSQNVPDTTAGQSIYTASCAACHGDNGAGFRELYPALGGSSYLDSEISTLVCLIRSGIKGTIVTGDGSYNRRMPSFPKLSGEQTAELINYMQVRWAEQYQIITAETVERWLESCP